MRGLVLAGLVACTSPNPAFCELDSDCLDGQICDLQTNGCVAGPPPGCTTNDDCDAALPICNGDGACQACVLDDECDSQVCQADGGCVPENGILYASPDGISAGECEIDTPCELSFALSKVGATRSIIRLANGAYALTFDIVVDAGSLTLVGGSGATISRAAVGPAFEVRGSATLELRGFVTTAGVDCTNAMLAISRLRFDNPVEARPWIDVMGCSVLVQGTNLVDAMGDGVVAMNSDIEIADSSIEGSAGNGLRCVTSQCEVRGSQIVRNQLNGIVATPTSLLVDRCSFTENRQGAISSIGGTFTVTNNFITRNGNAKDAKFGGARLEAAAGVGSQVEHNTIVFNDCDPFATPVLAGGLFCINALAPNNLIYNNFAGNNTAANAQVGGGCVLTQSLVQNGNGTNEMHFVSPVTEPFDFHLADSSSPAFNAGVPGAVTVDVDNQPRDGNPDLGADELVR